MKGIIFNLLEETTTAEHGEDHWDDLLDATGTAGSYTSLGSYEDEELVALVGAQARATHTEPACVLSRFGESATPLLADRYEPFFSPHPDTRTFLLTLNDVIHADVRKLYHGANPPHFDMDESDPSRLVMTYRSERRLCALAEGLIQGAARYYGEHVTIEQPQCMLKGDDHCAFHLTFETS